MSAPTIWQLIENLTHQMPLTPEKVAATIGTPLQPHKQTPQLIQYVGAGIPLGGNVRIENSSLALGPQGEFDDKSGLSLELGGACVTLDQVREHYGALKITQTPRGAQTRNRRCTCRASRGGACHLLSVPATRIACTGSAYARRSRRAGTR
ncbi:hypothetical protein ACFOHQ_14700 [Xanthomonas fragariae]